ncbi:MAG: DUF1153 domain-containing protein [Paracoccus denitrificans]|nr:MAG: DUF1153 domain-containing protein [Paracoccus denitrificans]PZO84497.1 MAG: DUF1153 domain-containing protein [Paracoccus denitrificans]
MFVRKTHGPRVVHLPDGGYLSLADLPPVGARWVASRKNTVVLAVEHGLIAAEEALRRYDLTAEELASWTSARAVHGRDALKVTSLQRYRHKESGQKKNAPLTGN